MKASELIKQLQQQKREHGDFEVFAGNPDEGLVMNINSAKYIRHDGGGEGIQIFSHVGPYCRECGRGCD